MKTQLVMTKALKNRILVATKKLNNKNHGDGKYNYEEPATLQEALNCLHKEQWKRALDNKHSSHVKNNTWTSVNIPGRRKAIDCRWLCKLFI